MSMMQYFSQNQVTSSAKGLKISADRGKIYSTKDLKRSIPEGRQNMKADSIVYTSLTGHTKQYAQMLGQMLELPVYSLNEVGSNTPCGNNVIYFGWIRASHVNGFKKASRRFNILAVCGVGLCDTGTMLDEVRKATAIPNSIPLFTLQGGIDRTALKGINRLLISMLTRGLSDQKQRSAQDERILELLTSDADYVCSENLNNVTVYIRMQQ